MGQHETSLSEQNVQVIWDHLESVTADRRRPGRLDHVSPNLIPLLRGEVTPGLALNKTGPVYDRERLPRVDRIAIIAVLSALLWAIIGCVAWAILG